MKIKKLELKNGYKRFHHLTIDLGEKPARIVALVGPNGCGKSSVLDGMLYHTNAHGAIGSRGAKDYTYHSMHGVASYNWQSVAIGFVGNININDDDVKDETNRIKNICGIITSVDPERFKRNLAAVIRPEMVVCKELEDCIFKRN